MTTPARIAILQKDLRGGGAERMMLNLAQGLVMNGLAVDLVLCRKHGELVDRIPNGVRVIDLGRNRTLAAIWPLMRYLRTYRPAALLSAQVHVNTAAVIAARCARRPTRIVISERNATSIDRHSSAGLAVRLAHWAIPYIYRRADAVIAVSDGVAEDLAQISGLPRPSIAVLPNPTVPPDLQQLAAHPTGHAWLDGPGAPVILGVGRLTPQKDFPTLIHAFAALRRHREARLVILGEGTSRPALEALAKTLGIEKDVSLPGFSDNAYSFMARAKVMALSSAWEGSPNALVEAMACGTPVVATDCPYGPRQILAGGQLGPLVPVGDSEALAEGLVAAMDHPVSSSDLMARADDYSLTGASRAYLGVLLPAVRTNASAVHAA